MSHSSAQTYTASATGWYAIYTRYKCEKQVVKDLMSKGIHAYLPLMERVKRYTRKIRRYQVPLINCYVFVKIEEQDKVKVLETENVSRFIKPGAKLVTIPEEEINTLKRIVGDVTLDVEVQDFKGQVGDLVEIISGSLAGLKGTLVSELNKNTVIIGLENLGYQFHVNVDVKMVKRTTK
ncbi:MAG TPA: UpxY family transcription antiterminator [Saprospiraceae bacterium]|nr:UpxY family transcription antiterminator [Saprospiraceae bacterium]